MLERILDHERDLFLFLNSLQSQFGNQFMWLFSGKITWVPASALFIIILLYQNRQRWKEVILIFVAIALVITLCDQFASSFCKPFFARFRPTHHPDFMDEVNTVFDYRGGLYGFISSHAANAFGFATLTSIIFKNRLYSITIFLWAFVNSYSRIYLGVHFISDIVPGIVVGLVFGYIVYVLFELLHYKLFPFKPYLLPENISKYKFFPYKGLTVSAYLLILTFVIITILSALYSVNVIEAIR